MFVIGVVVGKIVTDLKQRYADANAAWISLRDEILAQFVASKEKLVTCPKCQSVLSRKHSSQLYLWTRANCLVCRGSLLSEYDKNQLKIADHKRQVAYAELHGKPLPKLCGDVNIEPHLEEKKSWFSWKGIKGLWNG